MKLQERFRKHLQAKGKIPMDQEAPRMMADGGRVDYSQDEFHDDSDEWVDGDYNNHDTHAYAFGGKVSAEEDREPSFRDELHGDEMDNSNYDAPEEDKQEMPKMKRQFAMALARRGR